MADMEASVADIERLVSQLVVRSTLVEKAVHGSHEWTVLVANEHMLTATIDIDLRYEIYSDVLVVSFTIPESPADDDAFRIYCDGEPVLTLSGEIRKGVGACVVLHYEGAPHPAVTLG